MQYLIIRPGAIGDTLLSFPVIQALRAHSNSPHVTFVGNAAVLPLALDWGIAEEVSDYNARQWSALFATTGIHSPPLQALLRNVDHAICWLRDPEQIVEHNLRSSGVPQISIAAGRPAANERIYIVDYLASTLKIPQAVPFIPLFSTNSRITDKGVSMQQIAIHPGSGGAQKCWPTAYFAQLIEALWRRDTPVLLLAGPADVDRLADLLFQLPAPASASLLSTLVDAPLRSVAQHLQQCRGYIGNDSGITHLAALLAIPTLALFGPSDPVIWHPYGDAVQVLYEPVLANLSINRVLSSSEAFFGCEH
jgi:heptosyltransferase III